MASRLVPSRWNPLDRVLVAYTLWVSLLVAWRAEHVDAPGRLLLYHALLLVFFWALPTRGSGWERRGPSENAAWRALRVSLRFMRYTYPLLLVIFYFEEVENYVNALSPASPYWFEEQLYAWDRALFGVTPAIPLNRLAGGWLDEPAHFFYMTYYWIIILGGVLAFTGLRPFKRLPAEGCDEAISATLFAYMAAFVWYPLLPARGPWENPELMADMTPFRGAVFVPFIEWIIAGGSVSGACFPSGHVAGSFGMTFGLAPRYPRVAAVFGVMAVGMAFACVYTRYHHAADVAAGLACAALGAWAARRFSRSSDPQPTASRSAA